MDDASERAIEEDMLDQFKYFEDEDEELIDRREPAPLDSFDLVDEEPDEDEGESAEPSRCLRLSLWCRACICIARCITCAPSTRSICSAGLCAQCSS